MPPIWRTSTFPFANRGGGIKAGQKVVIGVCALEKKAKSKPMTQILQRLLAFGEFEVVYFGDDVIHNVPVADWPLCDCLISFYSEGFPLEKAEAYASLRKPYLLNDLAKQHLLLDRRSVYAVLQAASIAVPPHAVVSRDPATGEPDVPFEESEKGVVVAGVAINKPLVEKPVSGEDHSVYIYYPDSMGGGGKMLFRKRDDRSAEFNPQLNRVRRDGSFVYESYLPTMGTDVKVYTVGPYYAHAEARKSPTVDGRVHRQADGKEVRYPVLLSTAEKEIARQVCLAFGQTVCGFDLLRSGGKSYVCDVNGWSFVKNSEKYFVDAAGVLRTTILNAVAPHVLALALPSPSRRLSNADMVGLAAAAARRSTGGEPGAPPASRLQPSQSSVSFAGGSEGGDNPEELRCVIAVIRHGDRTPKQKMKLRLRDDAFLALYAAHRPRGGRAEQVKLKSAEQLQGVLDACRDMLRRLEEGADCGVAPEDRAEKAEKLRAVVAVLSRKSSDSGGHFSGINRKVQLKPLVVEPAAAAAAEAAPESEQEAPPADEVVKELQLIVKHGGVLTHAGRAQAEALGSDFRRTVYPPARYDPDDACGEGAGLLRLHSTYRHDLKIWSSDEGRVQMSAAAFAKGLLDLEGTSLAPILVSLVNLNGFMLDAFDKGASEDIRAAKAAMSQFMTAPADDVAATMSATSSSAGGAAEWGEDRSPRGWSASPVPRSPTHCADGDADAPADAFALGALGAALAAPPLELLRELLVHIQALREEIQERIWAAHGAGGSASPQHPAAGGSATAALASSASASGGGGACSEETLFLLLERWRKLERGLYSTRKGTFDISKIPDIFDAVKYDALHSRHYGLSNLPQLLAVAQQLADVVIPNEYGITPVQKLRVGAKVCSTLLGKILRDFAAVREEATAAWREQAEAASALSRSGSTASARASAAHLGALADEAAAAEAGGAGGEHSDEDADGGYRLHAQYADDINSKSRHVRTRLYFTSESHMHALLNVIRYSHLADAAQVGAAGDAPAGAGGPARRASAAPPAPLVSVAGEAVLSRTRELDYLSTVIFRMFELKDVPPSDPNKFRIELAFSPGAVGDPFAAPDDSHMLPVAPRVPLWQETEAGAPGGPRSGGGAASDGDGSGAAGAALTLNRLECALGAFAASWRAKGCPELGGLHQRSFSGPGMPRDSA